MSFVQRPMFALATCLCALFLTCSTGCDDDRDVMEVETPSGEVEVERDVETGALEVEED